MDAAPGPDGIEAFKGKGPRAGGPKPGGAKKAAPPGKKEVKSQIRKTKPLSQGKSDKKAAAGKNPKKYPRGKSDKKARKQAIHYAKPANLPRRIDPGQQGKHVKTHTNYRPGAGKSVMLSGVKPQRLLDGVHAGRHKVVGYTRSNRNHPVVKFDRPIGRSADGKKTTRYGSLHHGKNGAHIVPHFGAMKRP